MSVYYNISAPAKLNLNLIIRGKAFKGLHYLESDMCFLELSDKIYLKFSNRDAFYQNKDLFEYFWYVLYKLYGISNYLLLISFYGNFLISIWKFCK